MKCLGINLEKKYVKNLYPENSKTLPTEIRELNKMFMGWKTQCCLVSSPQLDLSIQCSAI